MWKAIHPVFNKSLLTPYKEPEFPSQKKPVPPLSITVEGLPEYKVESINNSRIYYKQLQYLVNWKWYPKEEWTWEKATELKKVQKKINNFHQRNPSMPQPISEQL